ncbi:MAG: hypothetical protein L3J93_05590 [Thermoplasmata archaeon]|nr:hypothetical protein [Thermoplasmata archaeon]
MRLFGSRKAEAPPVAREPEPAADPSGDRRFDKKIDIYPATVKLLWHYFNPSDLGKEEGTPKELPGPVADSAADGVAELEKIGLVETVPRFGDFGITAKLTSLGLQVMADQTEPGRLAPVRITNPTTRASTIYAEIHLGY